MNKTADLLMEASDRLARSCARMKFSAPVTHVYNPLKYAREAKEIFLQKYASPSRIIFLGMNPGPFGMAQTGIPFGEIASVRDWLKITSGFGKPKKEHPKRPVLGIECPRSEVSGRRFWGFMKKEFGSPGSFFKDHYVANYCPLVFMEESGRNRTPDKLPPAEREKLYRACDRHLKTVAEILKPEWIIGIGKFAEKRAATLFPDLKVGTILHPSPASPKANAGWEEEAKKQLSGMGLPG